MIFIDAGSGRGNKFFEPLDGGDLFLVASKRSRASLPNRTDLPVTCVPGSASWVRVDSHPELQR